MKNEWLIWRFSAGAWGCQWHGRVKWCLSRKLRCIYLSRCLGCKGIDKLISRPKVHIISNVFHTQFISGFCKNDILLQLLDIFLHILHLKRQKETSSAPTFHSSRRHFLSYNFLWTFLTLAESIIDQIRWSWSLQNPQLSTHINRPDKSRNKLKLCRTIDKWLTHNKLRWNHGTNLPQFWVPWGTLPWDHSHILKVRCVCLR